MSFVEIKLRQDVIHHHFHAGVLQADRIKHAHGGLSDAMRRIAHTRFTRGALQNNCTSIAIAEAFNAGVLLAKTHTT